MIDRIFPDVIFFITPSLAVILLSCGCYDCTEHYQTSGCAEYCQHDCSLLYDVVLWCFLCCDYIISQHSLQVPCKNLCFQKLLKKIFSVGIKKAPYLDSSDALCSIQIRQRHCAAFSSRAFLSRAIQACRKKHRQRTERSRFIDKSRGV